MIIKLLALYGAFDLGRRYVAPFLATLAWRVSQWRWAGQFKRPGKR